MVAQPNKHTARQSDRPTVRQTVSQSVGEEGGIEFTKGLIPYK